MRAFSLATGINWLSGRLATRASAAGFFWAGLGGLFRRSSWLGVCRVLGNGGEMGADGEGRISAEVRALGIFTRLFFVSFCLSFSIVLAVCFASSAYSVG